MANLVPPVPYKSQVINEDGFISSAWSKWFRDLFVRIGGSQALSNLELSTDLVDIPTIKTNITTLQGLVGSPTSSRTASSVVKRDALGNFAVSSLSVVSKAGAYTATISDDVILCSASSAAWTLTLPKASDCVGKLLLIKKTDSSTNAITIHVDGTDNIDGSLTHSLATQYQTVMLVANTLGWSIF